MMLPIPTTSSSSSSSSSDCTDSLSDCEVGFVLLRDCFASSLSQIRAAAASADDEESLDEVVKDIKATMSERLGRIEELTTGNSSNRTELGDLGCCELILSIIRAFPNDATLVERSCLVAANLAYSSTNKTKLGAAGFCEAVLETLRFHALSSTASVVKMVCWCSINLSASHKDNAARLGRAGGVEMFRDALGRHSAEEGVVQWALLALAYLCTPECPANVQRADESGLLVSEVFATLQRHRMNAGIAQEALHVLAAVAVGCASASSNSESRCCKCNDRLAVIHEAQLAMAAHWASKEVCRWGCAVLEIFVSQSPYLDTSDAGRAIDSVLAACQQHPSSTVTEQACRALESLLAVQGITTRQMSAAAASATVTTVVHAITWSSAKSLATTRSAMKSLARLSENASAVEKVFSMGGYEHVIESAEAHIADYDVAHMCCTALRHACEGRLSLHCFTYSEPADGLVVVYDDGW